MQKSHKNKLVEYYHRMNNSWIGITFCKDNFAMHAST